jgi:hypothetical protein
VTVFCWTAVSRCMRRRFSAHQRSGKASGIDCHPACQQQTRHIHEMTRSRKLSETVGALNELALNHPRHKTLATAALENLGMRERHPSGQAAV